MLTTIALAATVASPAKSASLTIYNDGFALVKEVRSLNLTTGEQDVVVEDVAHAPGARLEGRSAYFLERRPLAATATG